MNKRWKPLNRRHLARVVGARLNHLRRARGWRPERLASMMEIPRPLLERYERGELLVPTYTLYQLSGAMNVNVGGLFGDAADGVEYGQDDLAHQVHRLEALDPATRYALIEFLKTSLDAIERWRVSPGVR